MLNTWLFKLQQLLVVLISAFASLVCILVGITSPAAGLKICKKYKRIIKKKKKNHDKIVLLEKCVKYYCSKL